MPQQSSASIENNFSGGLKTEFTGLNFPENAATDTDNSFYDIVGNVTRRLGYNYEENHAVKTAAVLLNKAKNTYEWRNAGGDGNSQLLVTQVGPTLSFYKITAATAANPLSTQLLSSTVNITTFLVAGSSLSIDDLECQFSDGNGYLFVYHPHCEPFFVTYDPATNSLTGTGISIKIRDFGGWDDTLSVTTRPPTLADFHLYNLLNQGWTQGSSWSAQGTPAQSSNVSGPSLGTHNWNVPSGLPATPGTIVRIYGTSLYVDFGNITQLVGQGIVSAYSGNTLTVVVNAQYSMIPGGNFPQFETFVPTNVGYIDTWHTATGFYPSNADVWWNFKNSSDVFDPATTLGNTTISSPAPKGSFILQAFNLNRASVSGIASVPTIATSLRPRTGTWFQGRVWYAGVDSSKAAVANVSPYYTWTENIYFSQIVQTPDQFGQCYQINDPTSENLFNLLPTDGGVISIQGSGAVYRLFPIQNGLIVFAANGIWFITGSQGIGFSANDYTVTKISEIKAISSSSFVNVQGMPVFWNGEGIYTLAPAQQGLGLTVTSITYNSIDTFFNEIPYECRKYARGDYNPIDYIIQWAYRDTDSSSVEERYQFNKILNYNVQTKAFYPYSLPTYDVGFTGVKNYICGVNFIQGPGGLDTEMPKFKYLTYFTNGTSTNFTFAEELDDTFVDWSSIDYTSTFTTGYKIRGQGQRKYQPGYVYMYSNNVDNGAYKIQGIFDYANNRNSGQYSSIQLADFFKPNYGIVTKRHKLRGQGLVLQLKIMSVQNKPFDIIGWSIWENQNTGV